MIKKDLAEEEFRLFQSYILENSGIYFDKSQEDSMRISLLARINAKGFKSYRDYYSFLKFDPLGEEEFKELLSYITVNETYFLRDPSHFQLLKEVILPQLLQEKIMKGEPIKIWSAGCSTGEEPYSIAMAILGALSFAGPNNIEILGTDVSKKALATAEEGIYSLHALRIVDKETRDKFFTPVGQNRFKIKDMIKKMVKFEYFNLIKEPYPFALMKEWDIIFCRNVTIYFKIESTKRVIHNFYTSLKNDGFLFTGYSESLQYISDEFVLFKWNDVFIYKKDLQQEAEQKETNKIIANIRDTIDNKKIVKIEHEEPEKLVKPTCSARDLYNRAMDLFNKKDLKAALEKAKKALETDSKMVEAHFLIGRIYADTSKFVEAVEECQKAVRLVPLFAAAHFLLGIIYDKIDQKEEAIKEYKKVIYIDRDFVLAYFNLAGIYHMQNKSKESLKSYHNTIDILKRYPEGKVLEFADGFTSKLLIQICQKNIKQIQNSIIDQEQY